MSPFLDETPDKLKLELQLRRSFRLITYDAFGRVTVVTNALGSFTNEYVGIHNNLNQLISALKGVPQNRILAA